METPFLFRVKSSMHNKLITHSCVVDNPILPIDVVSQRRVCRNMDIVLLAELEQLILVQAWVKLDLQSGGSDPRVIQNVLDLSDVEVGQAYKVRWIVGVVTMGATGI